MSSVATAPITPLKYAEHALRDPESTHTHYYPRKREELPLLRSIDGRASGPEGVVT